MESTEQSETATAQKSAQFTCHAGRASLANGRRTTAPDRRPAQKRNRPHHYTVYDVRPRLRCSRCGEINPDVQPDWDNQPTVEYSLSPDKVTKA